MFMHKALMGRISKLEGELDKSIRDVEYYKALKTELEDNIKYERRAQALAIEESKNAIRKDMQKALVESDLRRVKAEAALETYEKMDTKDDHKQISKMLEKAIDGLAKGADVTINNKQ